MNQIEKIVTSLEVSKKLKALGIIQESCFYWVPVINDEYYLELRSYHDERYNDGRSDKYISAFTVTEMVAINDGGQVYMEPNEFGEWLVRRCSFGLQYDNEREFSVKSSGDIIQNRIKRLNQNLKEWREK